jgi:hypothetical protein
MAALALIDKNPGQFRAKISAAVPALNERDMDIDHPRGSMQRCIRRG